MQYSIIPILALIVHLVVNYDVIFNVDIVSKPQVAKSYRLFSFAVIAFFVIDALWGLFDFLILDMAATIDTAFYFVFMGLTVLLWTRFATTYLEEKTIAGKILVYLGWAFFIAGFVTVIINFFNPILFTVKEGQYAPALARHLFLGSQSLLFLATSVRTFIRSYRKEGKARVRYLVVGLSGLVMIIAIGLQMFFPNMPAYAMGLMVSLVLVHTIVVAGEKREYRAALAKGKLRERQQEEELGSAKKLAYLDPLTGTMNKHAYVENEEQIDVKIRNGEMPQFSIIVFDLNDLKVVNDTQGHEAGDRYIIDSVNLIEKYFPNAPLYRFGGDEFVLFLEEDDFAARHDNLAKFNAAINDNVKNGGPIVATGLSDYRKGEDNTLRAIFGRADEAMYIRKRKLKQGSNPKLSVRTDLYELFYRSKNFSLIEMLNNSACDEIMEVDMNHDTFKQFYHVDGKYAVPNVTFSYRDLFDFVKDYIVHPDDREIYIRFMDPDRFFERLAKGRIPNFDFAHFRYRLQDGEYRYVEQCVITGEENDIPPGVFRLYVYDIHNLIVRQLGQESNLENVPNKDRDDVTGLLVEEVFFHKAQTMVNEAPDKKWCLVSIDVEHFRFFDEWYGRDTGDLLLAKIGAVIAENEGRMKAIAGYLGQDDFAIVCPYDEKAIESLYEQIRALIVSFGLSIGFLPAIGVALIEDRMHVVDAYDRANIAISRAKKDLRHRIYLFDAKMKDAEEDEYRILSEFVTGIKNDEFTFYLQPQCRISTKQIVGAESLARWIKADGTMVSPAQYIPILEKYGFICDLDQVLWEKVCIWLRSWMDRGNEPIAISLNVSRADILTIDIAEHFRNLAAKYNIPHKFLKIEITESAYIETTNIIDPLVRQLRKDGFMVMMDDFGSGYSSLNMLSNVELDAIKIDANFLRMNGADYERGIHILESVINMTKIIGLPPIVEGVETQEQADFLSKMGCRYVQGFLYYRPMPAADFETLISDPKKVDRRGFVVKLNEQFRIREFMDKNIYSDTMLNNILGAVALYSWHDGEHVDIVRFNEQFYESVGVPDFSDRLINIEQFLPEEDHPKMFAVLKQAMENKLSGAAEILRFYKSDGSLTSYRMHFYYLGKKEGGERFYGSAINVTDIIDLQEEMGLIAHYSQDNLIFVSHVGDKWVYHVASHGLSDIFGLKPEELEAEMNDGRFAKRVVGKGKMAAFMKEAEDHFKEKQDFTSTLSIRGKGSKSHVIELNFSYVGDQTNNFVYVLRSNILPK